jgi:hypothetical protein
MSARLQAKREEHANELVRVIAEGASESTRSRWSEKVAADRESLKRFQGDQARTRGPRTRSAQRVPLNIRPSVMRRILAGGL